MKRVDLVEKINDLENENGLYASAISLMRDIIENDHGYYNIKERYYALVYAIRYASIAVDFCKSMRKEKQNALEKDL